MDISNNMGVPEDHSSYWHHGLTPRGFASSSYISPDLCGITYHSQPYPPFMEKSGNDDLGHTANFYPSAYPSPPSTCSNSKRSVPLPSFHADHEFTQERCRFSSRPFGGVLDSPLVMRHDSLAFNTPISPPPTLPTKTQALPPLDDSVPLPLASIQELDDSDGSLFVNTSSLPRDDHRGDQPLSPVSPEWATNGIPAEIPQSPERSFLLHQSHSNLFDYATDESGRATPSTSRAYSPPFRSLDQRIPRHPWDLSSPLPLSPPVSPIPQKLGLEDLDSDMFEPEPPISSPRWRWSDPMFTEDVPLPSSPSVHSLSLPVSDDDMQEVLEDDDKANTPYHVDTRDHVTDYSLSPPPSPGQSLLALPDADPDEDLYFVEPEAEISPYSPLYPNTSSRSLLLLDEPNDVPPPRSPSPENFQLDPAQLALEGCTDPEIRRLWDLRKKSQAAERTARILEAQALEEGGSGGRARWEARQTKKNEKERGREIAAMLRLKLAEKGVRVDDGGSVLGTDVGLVGTGNSAGVEGDHSAMQVDGEARERSRRTKTKKNMIGSMEQLVAQMLLRRNDASRSIVNRKSPVYSHSKSPLSHRMASAVDSDGEMDMDEDDEDVWGLKLRSWPMQ